MLDVVLDTDVASLLQKDRAPAWVDRQIVGRRVWLSFVGVGELWKWAEIRSWGEANVKGQRDLHGGGHQNCAVMATRTERWRPPDL